MSGAATGGHRELGHRSAPAGAGKAAQKAYYGRPKKDGTLRKYMPNWHTIWFDGKHDSPDQVYGFAQKWADYHEAWELLSNEVAS